MAGGKNQVVFVPVERVQPAEPVEAFQLLRKRCPTYVREDFATPLQSSVSR